MFEEQNLIINLNILKKSVFENGVCKFLIVNLEPALVKRRILLPPLSSWEKLAYDKYAVKSSSKGDR